MKLTALGAALLLFGSTAAAQEAPKPTYTFALKGFVSMSSAYQTGTFFLSEGQQSLAAGAEPTADKDSLTFDVRQSRFNFSVQGPKVLSGMATPTSVLEIDFFQGFGAGAFGDVSLLNRLRLAYVQLDFGATKVQFGQNNDLIFAQAPTSISHVAFPLGYFTGNLGWRRPGVFAFHNLKLQDGLSIDLAGEIGRSQWNDAAAGIGAGAAVGAGTTAAPNGFNQGEASGMPAFEGRAAVNYGKLLNVWVAGHYNQVDLTGVGPNAGVGTKHTVAVSSYHAGLKLNVGPVTLAGTGFMGTNVGPLVGNFAEIKLGPNGEDVDTVGYWAQAGVNLTKEFSLWALYGNQKPDSADAKRAMMTRLENTTTNVMAMYRDGGMAFSLEWIQFDTAIATYAGTTPGSAFVSKKDHTATQYMGTATYFF